jgi:hypothetical protein
VGRRSIAVVVFLLLLLEGTSEGQGFEMLSGTLPRERPQTL